MNHTILKALKRKGFSSKMSGHIKLTFIFDGKETAIRTWISHSKKEISDRLLGIMAEQLSLSRQELDDLVDCSLGKRELITLYEQKGVL